MLKMILKKINLLSILFTVSISVGHAKDNIKELKFCATEWAPYTTNNPNNKGLLFEISRSAFERVGYKINLDIIPWNRCLKETELGEYHGVLGAYFSKERAKWSFYSKPFFSVQSYFISRKKLNFKEYKELSDLKPFTIGVVRKWKYEEKFDSIQDFKKHTVNKSNQLLKLLSRGRVDIIVMNDIKAIREINKDFSPIKNDFVFIKPPLSKMELHNIFSKKLVNGKNLRDSFNKGFELILKEGTYKKVLKANGAFKSN